MKCLTTFCFGLLMLPLLAVSSGCGHDGNANASHPSTTTNAATASSPENNATSGSAAGADAPAATESRSAEQVLKDMEAVYAKANSYADNGQVLRRFERERRADGAGVRFFDGFCTPQQAAVGLLRGPGGDRRQRFLRLGAASRQHGDEDRRAGKNHARRRDQRFAAWRDVAARPGRAASATSAADGRRHSGTSAARG